MKPVSRPLSEKYFSHLSGASTRIAGSSGTWLRCCAHLRTTSTTSVRPSRTTRAARSLPVEVSISTAASIGTTSIMLCWMCSTHCGHWALPSGESARTSGSSQPPGKSRIENGTDSEGTSTDRSRTS
ncbi:hypothetical protein ACFWNN_09565 [Lentzea sp. NPDC058450]|uniref:hypothetical protein n=1 Tax=Lentzea sp. NPDC058450 TaxID=3346505 RepID=UPI003653D609